MTGIQLWGLGVRTQRSRNGCAADTWRREALTVIAEGDRGYRIDTDGLMTMTPSV